MNVKIIRPQAEPKYSLEIRKVRIEFIDGSHMVGKINIHAKHQEDSTPEYDSYTENLNRRYKFKRTSDYLRECSQSDNMLTVFEANYTGRENLTCFVFLHSVKFICEED